ncbi:MAG: hypothetical protein KIT44_09370 [Opitutaceae bacterium]|nr:hypothetical protein [Opitutaceae bacterium]
MAIPIVISPGGSGCCTCDKQLTPCNCSGPGCTIQCRSRSGFAQLCGYDEFTEPSDPPKKYRKRRVTGDLYRGSFPSGTCSTPSDDPVNYSRTGFAPIGGFWGDSTVSGVAAPVEADATQVKYRASGLAFTVNSSPTAWGFLTAVSLVFRSVANPAIQYIFTSNGQQIWIPRSASPYDVFLIGTWSGAGGINASGSEEVINFANVVADQIRDHWDLTTEYKATNCHIIEDSVSARVVGVGKFPLNEGGTLDPSGPSLADFDGLLDETLERTVRTLTGTEDCVGSSAPYLKAIGERVESLSDEDTIEDAIQRVLNPAPEPPAEPEDPLAWTTLSSCAGLGTAFITLLSAELSVSFRVAQVRAHLTGLTIGAGYEVRYILHRRVAGTSGPFVFFGVLHQTITAPAAEATTEWVDIPNEEGWETRVMACNNTTF